MADTVKSAKEILAEKVARLEAELNAAKNGLLVEDRKDDITAAVIKAVEGVEDAQKLLSANRLTIWYDGGNIAPGFKSSIAPIQAVAPKRTRKAGDGTPTTSTNGNGKTNFGGKPVTVHSDALAAQYGLGDTRTFDSIRKLYLAIGGAEEERHPDNVLRKDHKDLWKDIMGEGSDEPAEGSAPATQESDQPASEGTGDNEATQSDAGESASEGKTEEGS